MVSVVIPAHDEAPRIAAVLDAALRSPAHEVIVVDDGSTDGTADVARRYHRARVLRLSHQGGKGAAMAAGIRASSGDVVVFLDGDLTGLRPYHVEGLIHPVSTRSASMVIGQMGIPIMIAVHTSGQRATTRAVCDVALASGLAISGYRADNILLTAARTCGGPIYVMPMDGVGHVQKMGKWVGGLGRTLSSHIEVGSMLVDEHPAAAVTAGAILLLAATSRL